MTIPHTFSDSEGGLWFRESLSEGFGNAIRIDHLVESETSSIQDLILFDNNELGRVLALDGLVQLSTRDERVYHEMVSHVPMIAHGAVGRVLIIGGGDGGVAREVLRHPGVERIDLVEIDPEVIQFSKEWLPEISAGSLSDERVKIIIADGSEYVRKTSERYDLIIVDSSDPVGPNEILFTEAFYSDCRSILNANGAIVTQSGLISFHPATARNTLSHFRKLFDHASCFLICVPAFSGGFMALGIGSNSKVFVCPVLKTLQRRWKALNLGTYYYTPELHFGSFQLPRFAMSL